MLSPTVREYIRNDSGFRSIRYSGESRYSLPVDEIRPSEGSRKGVKYVAAAGKTISNEGEKLVKAETEEGHVCNLIIQVTAVNKALLEWSARSVMLGTK